ncbi:MAG TPA: biotin transporter BioY [Niallia sp.]|nr:biotin transporter BioY [Niallia sp.]
MKGWKTIDITMIALFVALMAVGANITSFLIIGGVPVTLQTFFALLAGFILGKRLGSLAMLIYMIIGLIGMPIFSGVTGGLFTIAKPSFGFIIAFIPTAYFAGLIVEKKDTIKWFVISAFIGLFVNYLIGTTWMYIAYKLWFAAPDGFNYSVLWSWMALPLIKDLLFTYVAAVVGMRMNQLVVRKSYLSKDRFSNNKGI